MNDKATKIIFLTRARKDKGDHYCQKCRDTLFLGDKVVRKQSHIGTYKQIGVHSVVKYYHPECYTDAHGEPLFD